MNVVLEKKPKNTISSINTIRYSQHYNIFQPSYLYKKTFFENLQTKINP